MAARFTRIVIAFAVALSAVSAVGPAVAASPERNGVTVLSGPARWAGKIFVNHDEWTFRDDVYTEDAAQFARNIAAWFTKGRPGRFLAYSSNLALTGANLERTMTEAGHTWTVGIAAELSLPMLQQYDGVFLAGDPADNAVLIDYVRTGGNVYVAGGTGWGGPAAEAARWNPFLNAFGLSFASEYNVVAVGRYLPIQSASPLFHNVHSLWQFFGSSITVTDTMSGDTGILVAEESHGLYAAYEGPAVTVATDFAPSSCHNTLDVGSGSSVKLTIASTATFNASTIDPASVRLFGVARTQSSLGDSVTPTTPFMGRTTAACSKRTDGRTDLVLSFDSRPLVAAIKQALGREPRHGEAIALVVTGKLKSTFGSRPIVGEDVVVIRNENDDDGLLDTLGGLIGGLL
jgi:hypothetical protein